MNSLKKIASSAVFLMILSFSGSLTAQQNETQNEGNSLLISALKKHEANPFLDAKTIVIINKSESNLEKLKEIQDEKMKFVKVLVGDSVKKKYRKNGIEEVIEVRTL